MTTMNPQEVPEEELGAAMDQAVDRMVECRHAAHVLRQIYVDMDTIADSHDLPVGIVEMAREIQDEASDAADLAEARADEASEIASALRERIEAL